MGDIKYSQAIGQDSDNILSLFRDEVMIADKEMGVSVKKNREGTLGKVILNWDFKTMNFSSIYSETDSKPQEDFEEEEENDFARKDMITNEVILIGYICKKPIYRQTPFGREIADLLLAVNRAYNKSDYIPCIAWGRNARFSQTLEVGTKVKIVGRVQSRTYEKKYEDGTTEMKVAYEVSIGRLEVVEEEEEHKEEEIDHENQEAV